jgi:hypothetical protein
MKITRTLATRRRFDMGTSQRLPLITILAQ